MTRKCAHCGTPLVRRPEERIGQWEIRVACGSKCASKMRGRPRNTEPPAPRPCQCGCGVMMTIGPKEGRRRFAIRRFASAKCREVARKLGIVDSWSGAAVTPNELRINRKATYPPGYRYKDYTRADLDLWR